MPKKNAVRCTPSSRNPRSSANAAPKLAPEATPSVSGVARGLAKRLWNTQPETDSPAPTSAANNTRGSRIDHRTALACAPTSRPSSSETRSRTGTFIRPMQRHTSAHRTGAIRNTTSCHRRFLLRNKKTVSLNRIRLARPCTHGGKRIAFAARQERRAFPDLGVRERGC